MKNIFSFVLIFSCTFAFAQQKTVAEKANEKADSLYSAKNYSRAAAAYIALADMMEFNNAKAASLYNAACCLALEGKSDAALIILNAAIRKGYSRKASILKDTDLESLHNSPRWTKIINSIPEGKGNNHDPSKAKFITTDVHHFWKAYDKAMKDTANFKSIFQNYYFDKASPGMNDYVSLKLKSVDQFVKHIRSSPKYYKSIRANTFKSDAYKDQFAASFVKMKALYDSAVFPDVYFIIGAFTSGGTVSDKGLLLGLNQMSSDETTPTDEFSFAQKMRMNDIVILPNVVAHELIHFEQNRMKNDTTVLSYSIREGMADFIGELISGQTGNPKLFAWAKGKEKDIWRRFTADMYFDRYNNWIANGATSSPDNLPDQGYWVGYQICKAYYDNMTDKKQAIYDMLHIQDYKAFLEKSGWEKRVLEY